jgi:3-carboxy-cis,cis-muconate cycloisomerase
VKEQRHIDDVLSEDTRVTKHLGSDEIARLFDPLAYQGAAQAFIDRLIASTRA